MKKVRPPELDNPTELPESVKHIWEWFGSLSFSRQSGMGGPQPISESDIGWFFVNRRIDPIGFEADILRLLDAAFLECQIGK